MSSGDEIRHVPLDRQLALLALTLTACAPSAERARAAVPDTVVVYAASSLAVPLRRMLDSVAPRLGVLIQQENGASIELARRVTDLHRIPDVIALADQEVFPQLLMPGTTSWYARFARNRMVIAYTKRSRGANEMTAATWRSVLQRPEVLVGRCDPALAPAGYRTLLLFRLAERFYRDPGLSTRLEKRTPPTLMRANASELAALLTAGALDYVIDYESLARANHLDYVTLPPEIDLGEPAHAADYARDSVRVPSRTDTVTRVGAPILYGVSVPRAAPHREAAVRVLAFMLGAEGRALLRARSVDAIDVPELVGEGVPPAIRNALMP